MADLTFINTAAESDKRSSLEKRLLQHMNFLFRISYRFTGNREDAEDLVQDLVVKLYAQKQDLAEVAKPRPWLVRVLYRLFIDNRRKQKRFPIIFKKYRSGTEEEDHLEQVPGKDSNPEDNVYNSLLRRRIVRAMNMLGRDHRAIITLHDIEGYHMTELETLLEIPLGTIKSRLHRARAKLKEILKKDGTF